MPLRWLPVDRPPFAVAVVLTMKQYERKASRIFLLAFVQADKQSLWYRLARNRLNQMPAVRRAESGYQIVSRTSLESI